jgi:hypothetical protein
MARPKTKEELNNLSEKNFQKLFDLINSLTKEEQISNFLFEDRDKNIRDILVHLFEWHQLLLNWVNSNTSGTESSFLPKPYNWKTYPKLNIEFWEKHQKTPYDESIELLKESHLNAMKVINSFSNDELFIKKHFSWTGTTSLGSYCVSATSSHYDWAINKIKKHKKTLNK